MRQLDLRAVRAAHYARHKAGNQGSLREEYTEEERIVVAAVDRYKRECERPFPAITEVLAVIRAVDRHVEEVGLTTLAQALPKPQTRAERARGRGVKVIGRRSPPAGDDGDDRVVSVRRA